MKAIKFTNEESSGFRQIRGKSERILQNRSTRFVFYKSIAKKQKTLRKGVDKCEEL